eukprot:SAG22_NODE_612_length_8579_cov_3.684906_5_plen_74_part_00
MYKLRTALPWNRVPIEEYRSVYHDSYMDVAPDSTMNPQPGCSGLAAIATTMSGRPCSESASKMYVSDSSPLYG